MNTSPRAYFADLASYNAGYLHGAWVDCTLGVAHIESEIQKILASSPVPDAEEWSIHDFDGLPSSLGENPDLDTVAAVAEFLEEHDDGSGWAYLELFDDSEMDKFEDRYRGEYESREAMAEDYIESCGMLNGIPDEIARYFDVAAYGRDLMLDGMREDDGHYFYSC